MPKPQCRAVKRNGDESLPVADCGRPEGRRLSRPTWRARHCAMLIKLKVDDKPVGVSFRTFGCGIEIGCGSALSEHFSD